MTPQFGFSFGDIVKAIEIVWKIAEAFDNAKGAKASYARSRAFLRGLVPVLQRIQRCLETPQKDDDRYQKDILIQGAIIYEAYVRFEKHLDKRIGLEPEGKTKTDKLRYVTQVVLSALDELQKKVEKFQGEVVNAMALIGPVLALEIKAKIEGISQSLGESTEGNQSRFTELLESIQNQTSSLSMMSQDYKGQLAAAMAENRQDRKVEMGDIQKNVQIVEESQQKLADSLKFLSEQIDKQHQESKAISAADAERWARLSHDVATQSKSLDDEKNSTLTIITQADNALLGLGSISGNPRIAIMGQRLSGFRMLYELCSGYLSSMTTKESSPTQDSSARPQSLRSETMHRPPRPVSSKIVSTSHDEANQVSPTSLCVEQPYPRKARSPGEIVPPDRFLPPPSRTGQRPFVASRPSQRSQSPKMITVPRQARPPLPPRSPGPSDVRSISVDGTKLRPIPLPKSPTLNLRKQQSSPYTPSLSPSLDNQQVNSLCSVATSHGCPQLHTSAAPSSSYDSLAPRQSRSSTGTVSSSSVASPAVDDMETNLNGRTSLDADREATPASDEKFPGDGLLEVPEMLSFANKRKVLEGVISGRCV
ncbi:MAG: hypothetical protein Q9209_002132 [Squamulea sp. 1 TL-2023]